MARFSFLLFQDLLLSSPLTESFCLSSLFSCLSLLSFSTTWLLSLSVSHVHQFLCDLRVALRVRATAHRRQRQRGGGERGKRRGGSTYPCRARPLLSLLFQSLLSSLPSSFAPRHNDRLGVGVGAEPSRRVASSTALCVRFSFMHGARRPLTSFLLSFFFFFSLFLFWPAFSVLFPRFLLVILSFLYTAAAVLSRGWTAARRDVTEAKAQRAP